MAKLMTTKQLTRKIAAVQAAASKTVEAVHVVACHVAVHAIVHGDVTLATRLVTGLSKGIARRPLVAWLSERAPMAWDNAAKAFKYTPKRRQNFDADRAEELLDEYLSGVKFYDREPGDGQLAVDVLRLLTSIPKRVEKARSEGREVKHGELVKAVEDIIAKAAKAAA